MKRIFVESSHFARCANEAGVDVLAKVQAEILRNPEAGKVIQGTGGLRKVRIGDEKRGKGKRGGYRAIYLDLPHLERTYLLALYDKNEKSDISSGEKAVLKALVDLIKKESRL